MESGAAFFILLGAFLLIGIPVLAIAAYVRAGELKRQVQTETPQLIARIYALERQFTQIEKALATLSSSTVARSETPTASTPSPAAAVTKLLLLRLAHVSYPRWKSLEHLHRPGAAASPMQDATPVREAAGAFDPRVQREHTASK